MMVQIFPASGISWVTTTRFASLTFADAQPHVSVAAVVITAGGVFLGVSFVPVHIFEWPGTWPE